MLKTPDGTLIKESEAQYDESGRPYVFMWYDDAEDVTVAEQQDMAENDEHDVIVRGVWRQMAYLPFANQKIEEKHECECLHKPEKGRGRKVFGGRVPAKDCPACRGKGVVRTERTGTVSRWTRLVPFRPSNKQLEAYIRFKKHKVPIDRKTRKVTTTAKKIDELERETHDPLYRNVLDIRTVQKVRSTYVTGIGWVERDWVPKTDKEGNVIYLNEGHAGALVKDLKLGEIRPIELQPPRVHTTFTLGPATAQTSSRRPNIQNVPKHVRNENLRPLNLQKRFRKLIQARPGHRIWDFDLKSAHALTLGLEARDLDYCVASDTPILTADLRWRTADSLKIGDELVGFDEQSPKKRGHKRHIRKSIVTGAKRLKKLAAKITTEKGVAVVSLDHMWLSKRSATDHYRWHETGDIKPGDYIAYMIRPWESASTYEEGYIAGIFDGEGNVQQGQLSFAQKPGLVTNKALDILREDGFKTSPHKNSAGVLNQTIVGEAFAGIRALGKYRPVRLLAKFMNGFWGMSAFGKHSEPARVLSVEFLGEIEVIAIETSTKTFVANGFMSHNCRLARIDVHSWFASVLAWKRKLWDRPVDAGLPDDQLRAALAEFRAYVHPSGIKMEADIRDVNAKPAILGIGFGMMGNKLYETNKESFENKFDAQDTIDLFFEYRPLLKKYQEAVMAEAQDKKHLISRGGFIRWFWHVYNFIYDPRVEGKFTVEHGDDAEDCKAFRPANTAFVYMRDAEIRLEEMGVNELFNFINVVHDSNMFEGPDERGDVLRVGQHIYANLPKKADEMAFLIKQQMEQPQPLLGDPEICPQGLTIECDVQAGPSWGEMKKVKL